MTSREAYGGAVMCLREARSAIDGLDAIEWLQKARLWRNLARRLRRAGR